jgi:hypothetical protein
MDRRDLQHWNSWRTRNPSLQKMRSKIVCISRGLIFGFYKTAGLIHVLISLSSCPNGFTSAGWMFWFCNTRWVVGLLIFQNQRTSRLFGRVSFSIKNQNQRNHGLWLFEKPQRTRSFHERTSIEPVV